MVYGIIKLIIFVADLIRISLGEKFIVHSFLKVLTVELVILIGLFEIPILLNGYLQIVVPGEPLLNSLVSILSYIEAIKIFWNWVIKYEKYRKFYIKENALPYAARHGNTEGMQDIQKEYDLRYKKE